MTQAPLSAISLTCVTKTFEAWGGPIKALRDISLDIPERGLVLIIGSNASGKSTLLRVIGGSLRATSGRVQVFGRNPETMSARWRAKTIASVGQHPERDLVPQMTIEDHARLFGLSWQSFANRLSMLEPDGHFSLLGSSRKQPVEALSGGQRQALGLAVQLVRDTPILLLDEPFAALDPDRLAAFTRMIARLSQTRCVVNVTHAPEPLLSAASAVVRLEGGVAEIQTVH